MKNSERLERELGRAQAHHREMLAAANTASRNLNEAKRKYEIAQTACKQLQILTGNLRVKIQSARISERLDTKAAVSKVNPLCQKLRIRIDNNTSKGGSLILKAPPGMVFYNGQPALICSSWVDALKRIDEIKSLKGDESESETNTHP